MQSVDLELALAPAEASDAPDKSVPPDTSDTSDMSDSPVAQAAAHADPHRHAHARSPLDPPPDPSSNMPVAPARAAHDELLIGLGRRFRGATLKLDFELRTNLTRQLFRRDFVYVSQQLHALEASRRVQGLDRQVLNAALISIERHGQFVKAMLAQASAEAAAMIAEHALATTPIDFSPPVPLQATIVSPYARAYIDLLRMADDTLTQLERAWLLGALAPSIRSQLIADCRKLLQGYKEIVRQQRHVVGEAVREVNTARRAKRDEPAASADLARSPAMRRAPDDAGASPTGAVSASMPSDSTDAEPDPQQATAPLRLAQEPMLDETSIEGSASIDDGPFTDDAGRSP